MSLMFLGYLAGLAKVLSRPELFLAGVPPLLKSLIVPALLGTVFVVLAVVAAVRAWKSRYWTFCSRAYFSLVVLAGLGFVVFLLYWKMMGFSF
jgi:hypothetical protein